ncbi:MAG: hypothetical protein Kow0037_05260 [Calditrichia bacterium]
MENLSSRKVIGFEAFGKLSDDLKLESDREFVKKFEDAGGYGISKNELELLPDKKCFRNYQFVERNILTKIPQ